jgi:hypothetical protein
VPALKSSSTVRLLNVSGVMIDARWRAAFLPGKDEDVLIEKLTYAFLRTRLRFLASAWLSNPCHSTAARLYS